MQNRRMTLNGDHVINGWRHEDFSQIHGSLMRHKICWLFEINHHHLKLCLQIFSNLAGWHMKITSRGLSGLFSSNFFFARWHHFLQRLGRWHRLYNARTSRYWISVPGLVEMFNLCANRSILALPSAYQECPVAFNNLNGTKSTTINWPYMAT